jgi:hypothetical protein
VQRWVSSFLRTEQNTCTKPNIKLDALVAFFATKAHHIIKTIKLAKANFSVFALQNGYVGER